MNFRGNSLNKSKDDLKGPFEKNNPNLSLSYLKAFFSADSNHIINYGFIFRNDKNK